MYDNPLLRRALRHHARLPKWWPEISTLWMFPLVAIASVILFSTSLGQVAGTSAAVGVGFGAALCAYPLYFIGGGISWLIPTRVAPSISSEVEAHTLDNLRLTDLSSAEIMVGKLLGALVPFAGILSTMATFFVLIAILGIAGAGAIPVVLGLPAGEVLPAIILVELPIVFGPILNIFFVSALSLAISAHTSHPESSVFATYGALLAYWILTTIALVMILTILTELELVDSVLVNYYLSNPLVFLLPNALRLTMSAALTPIFFHITVRRIRATGM